MNKNNLSKIALGATSLSTIALGVMLYNGTEQIKDITGQLDKSIATIAQQEEDYSKLEENFNLLKKENFDLTNINGQLNADNVKLREDYESVKSQLANTQAQLDKTKNELAAAKKNRAGTSRIGSSATVPAEYKSWKKLNVQSTAYTSHEAGDVLAGQWGGLTAMGTKARVGVIAVDPNIIPLGSSVYIPALGMTARAEDTGGAIKGYIIDIYFNTLTECNNWGRKNIDIYVNI